MSDKYEIIFKKYQKYMEDNSQYGVRVVKYNTNTSTYFPLITFELSNYIDTDNRTSKNLDFYEGYYFTINIYTKTKDATPKVAKEVIDKELEMLTLEFFRKLNIKRTLNNPIPNLDTSILRRTMQYQCEIGNRGNIIRR